MLLDEKELMEIIDDALITMSQDRFADARLRSIEIKQLPTENAGVLVVTLDGAEYVVCVTQIKEGDDETSH